MVPILFIGVLVLVLVVILFLTFGRGRGGTRVSTDGFYISTRGYRIGSRVEYRCLVGGEGRAGTVLIERGPDEIFVYTGGTPMNIRVDSADQAYISSNDDDDVPDSSPSFTPTFSSSDDGGSYGGSSGDAGDTGARGGESSAGDAGDAGGGFPPAY